MNRAERVKERWNHLSIGGVPTEDFPAYTEDEQTVCDYLQQIIPDVGCGADPISFLIASHNSLREELRRGKK